MAVLLQTNYGDITLTLNEQKAPKTVANFLNYVTQGFYDGTLFHRVINNFMIQGGGFEPDMVYKLAGEPIPNEADNGLENQRGTIAMARMYDPHSASCQFFINVVDNKSLDHIAKNADSWGYCVFGEVTAGMEVVDQIRKVPTTNRRGHRDVPVEDVIIQKAMVIED